MFALSLSFMLHISCYIATHYYNLHSVVQLPVKCGTTSLWNPDNYYTIFHWNADNIRNFVTTSDPQYALHCHIQLTDYSTYM